MTISSIKQTVFRVLRGLAITAACAVLVFSNVFPAVAFESSKTSPTAGFETTKSHPAKGAEPLDAIYDESAKALNNATRGTSELQKKANEGLNEVQGAANTERMYRPDNSQDATTIKDKVEDILENVTGRN